jgi:hypothetical protein
LYLISPAAHEQVGAYNKSNLSLWCSPTGNGFSTLTTLSVQGETSAPDEREFLVNLGLVSSTVCCCSKCHFATMPLLMALHGHPSGHCWPLLATASDHFWLLLATDTACWPLLAVHCLALTAGLWQRFFFWIALAHLLPFIFASTCATLQQGSKSRPTPYHDKVTLYAGIVANPGTGDVWSFNPLLTMSPNSGDYNAQGVSHAIGSDALAFAFAL